MLTPFIRKPEASGPLPDRDKRAVERATKRMRQVGVGRRAARGQIAPMPCEVLRRLQAAGLAGDGGGREA